MSRFTSSGFEIDLPKGVLEVVNIGTFPPPKFAHVIELRTPRQVLEIYTTATGKMRVFTKRARGGHGNEMVVK
jgi:hypothetical protein